MSFLCETLLDSFDGYESFDRSQRAACAQRAASLAEASAAEVQQLLEGLIEREPPPPDSAAESFLAVMLNALAGMPSRADWPSADLLPETAALDRIACLYKHLGALSEARFELLRMLSAVRNSAALGRLASLVVDDPPQRLMQAALAFAPLFQRQDYDARALFPKLLDGVAHQSVAGVILDLANFTTRNQLLDRHPATDRVDQLIALLGGLLQRLGCLEEQPDETGDSPRQIGEKVAESVAMAVSLCDALALIGDRSAVGKLTQALQLGHRRLRTEAAAALIRLGEESARAALVEMAAEPIARLRVLAYVDELGLGDRIDERFRTPQSRAESELALWLAEPTQMGVAPMEMELADQRKQLWPGYDERLECYLFRFTYRLESAVFSNIGIAGPLTHAFTADLGDLPPDEIYAAFAGWQAEHADIYELDCDQVSDARRSEIARLARRLQDAGYEQIEPVTLGLFFGEKVLVVSARQRGTAGLAVVDAVDVFWYPRAKSRRPLGPQEVYCIYKGRKLLRTFNV